MATITLKGNPISTSGDLPAIGTKAPDFKLVAEDLQDLTLASPSYSQVDHRQHAGARRRTRKIG